MTSTTSKSRESWVDAATTRFRDEGIRGVKVETLARDLGATKGSFYWHFANRRELVDAVMARWEAEQTDAIIAATELGGSARERLALLFEAVGRALPERSAELTLYVDAAEEQVTAAVVRVTQRRIAYLATLLGELGVDSAEATRRATVALAAVLGMQQLTLGSELSAAERERIIRTALDMTLPSEA